MSEEKASRLNWTPDEWLRVAVNMLPMLEQGVTRLVALARSMRKVLGKSRHHDDKWIQKASAPAGKYLNRYLDEARKLTPEQRDGYTHLTPAQAYAKANPDAPKPVKAAPAPRVKKTELSKQLAPRGSDKDRVYAGARWTTGEWAKICRMVQWFQSHNAPGALSRLVIEAQELVLPPDRRRSIPGIQASVSGGKLARNLKAAEANLWLLKDVPFDPPHPPGAEEAQEATETAHSGDEMAQGYVTPPPPHGAVLGASVAPSPSLTEPLHVTTAAAVQQFGETMMSALSALLSSHSQAVAHSFEARLADNASRMAAEVASMVEAGMRKAVATMLAHELGGPVAPAITAPAPPAPPTNGKTPPPAPNYRHNPVPPSADRPEQLKVDVVGFEIGAQESLVQSAFSGEVDLRFIHPDKIDTFAPHRGRHVVMMIGRVPHALGAKFRASKVTPIIVRRTPGHVIHAIEELQRARGANMAH